MNNKIWYELKSPTDINHIQILTDDLGVVKIDSNNFDTYKDTIQLSIDKFNSQINWDDMWDLKESKKRISQNQSLYLLLKNELPIGHVWYIGEYLYNAFVSIERKKGESQWFIGETIKDRFNQGYKTITLYTEEWNKNAIGLWEKLGFKIINKNELEKYGRELIHQTQGND